jgi:hypothetical protein
MTSTQNIDGDLMEASDGTLWRDFFQPPGVMFSSTLSGGVLSSIKLNAAVVGSQPFGRLQAADRKIYGHVVGCERDVVERNVPWDGWLAPPPARIINFQLVSGKAGSTTLCGHNQEFPSTREVQ